MNFLAHFLIATHFLDPVEPLSAYAVGTALPDLLPLAADRVRLRPAQMAWRAGGTEFDAALSAGVSAHLAADAAFHKSPAFAQAQTEISQMLALAEFDGIRVRRFFVSHILTELALDAVLLRAAPVLADRFYEAFISADFAAVTRWTKAVTEKPLPGLPGVLTRFSQAQYLRRYESDEGVAYGVSQLCRRARQDTFDGPNFTRLITVVSQAAAWLPQYVPALLSETAAAIFSLKQEVTDETSNAVLRLSLSCLTQKEH